MYVYIIYKNINISALVQPYTYIYIKLTGIIKKYICRDIPLFV